VKGYQHFAGRALTALKAIDIARHSLSGYKIRIFSPFPEVVMEANRLRDDRGLEISCLPERVAHEEILSLHGKARISLAISAGDGISTSLLEAMAMGSLPIQTHTACANEWIVDGESGFIVSPDDPEQIAQRLATALIDDGLVDRAAAINLARIEATGSREFVAGQIRRAYANISS
jgi:glycosyltransferase involved in cell wall biosynthesis